MVRAEELLKRGYFPKELPPSFSSEHFGRVASSLTVSAPNDWTQPVILNLARPGNLRRRLGIPNPFSQLHLAAQCEVGWTALAAHLKKSRISLSRPLLRKKGRALATRCTFDEKVLRQLARMNRARFTLQADITECYGSIYTHAIEWALHSKVAAKAALRSSQPASLGKRLDEAVRRGQDGQTKGIPIGPDTSLLLAELILCEADAAIQAAVPAVRNYCTRFMDDLEFCSPTRAEAEEVLLAWDRALNSYDLALNPIKTVIVEGPIAPDKPWRAPILKFALRYETDAKLANDLRSLFSLAFDLHGRYPRDAVLSYTIQRIRPRPTEQKSWNIFSQLCLAAVTADPSTLPAVADVFAFARNAGLKLPVRRLARTMNEMCMYHAPFEHGSEVAWSLATLRDHQLTLSAGPAKAVAQMQDNCSLLLLWDMINSGKVAGGGPDMSGPVSRAEDADA